jgi:hypothetical protein
MRDRQQCADYAARASTWRWVLALCCLMALLPWPALAQVDTPAVIEPQVVLTQPLAPSEPVGTLLVQATSWPGDAYYYILTLTNASPWPLDYMDILDRYFAEDTSIQEQATPRALGRLDVGQSVSFAVTMREGALENGCHQVEMTWSQSWYTVLMDCSAPGATTVWRLPLSEEMAVYLQEPTLTQATAAGPSKIGLHVTRNSSPKIMDYVRSTKPSVVVGVGGLDWLADVKRESPHTITLGRMAEGDQSMTGDPASAARAFVNANAGIYLSSPGVDYWLGWNEPGVSESWQMAWFAAFEAERVQAMAELGLKVAIGSFSTGTPEADRFGAFMSAIKVAKEQGGILAVHEYSAPTMREGVGAGIPGMEAGEIYGALTLRYRYWYDRYLEPNDLVIPLVVTEAGIDGGIMREQGVALGGWRDFVGAPAAASAGRDMDAYLGDLSWYDDELRRDPYVLGFAVFNVGGDSERRWASFDLTDELPDLAALAASKE